VERSAAGRSIDNDLSIEVTNARSHSEGPDCSEAEMRIHYAHVVGATMRKIASNAIRQPANLSIDSNLMREAKGLDVNVSRAAEAGIAEAVAAEKTRLWKLENRATMDAWNDYVEKHGIPLEDSRQF
jgi:antitoxin CcdA